MGYPSDVSDRAWAEIERFFGPEHIGRPRKHRAQSLCNAIRYVERSGCQWRMLPNRVWFDQGAELGWNDPVRVNRPERREPGPPRHQVGAVACDGMVSGVEVGDKPAFQMCDHVLEHQLALLQSLQFKLVDQRILGQAGNHIVQVAMLCPQFDEPVFIVFDVTVLHCGILQSRAGFLSGAANRDRAGSQRAALVVVTTGESSPTPNDRQGIRLGAAVSVSGKVSTLNTVSKVTGR